MPQCSSIFSVVFVFQKSYTGNILGIGRNKSRTSYFYLCSFSETQKQQKIVENRELALWHLISRLVTKNAKKNATKCNKTQSKWCINKHGASKIIDTFETYQGQSGTN
jgi:hypothetical protein